MFSIGRLGEVEKWLYELPGRLRVQVVYTRTMRAVAQLFLAGASAASVRYRNLVLTVGDDRGRVISVDLRYGQVRRDLRIHT